MTATNAKRAPAETTAVWTAADLADPSGWTIGLSDYQRDEIRLTPVQLDALEMIETIANDPAFHVEMDFQPGDVQLLNHAKILHSREAYEDHVPSC